MIKRTVDTPEAEVDTIGKRIKRVRGAVGLSQQALAQAADVSMNGIARLEQDSIKDPHLSQLRKIAAALGVSVGELVEEPVLAGKAEAPDAGHPQVAVAVVSDALASYAASRIRAYEEDLQDPDSPHFKTATTAALWGEMLHRESGMLIESMMAQSGPVIRALGSSYEKAWAGLTLARTAGKTLASFNKTRQLADQRIAAMRDVPDELAQKRLEKARREAEESAHRFEELRRVAL